MVYHEAHIAKYFAHMSLAVQNWPVAAQYAYQSQIFAERSCGRDLWPMRNYSAAAIQIAAPAPAALITAFRTGDPS